MSQFGGEWTKQKLDAVKHYLHSYVTAMKKQPFTLWYVDAFAGKGFNEQKIGSAPLLGDDEDAIAFIKGSPLNALAVQPPFHRYLFIEQSEAHAASLKTNIRGNEPAAAIVTVEQGDANEQLTRFCAEMDKNGKARAVVFLDPFATQVGWQTVERLGRTGKVDLWILFPIMAINRMLANEQVRQQPAWEKRLDEVFGTPDWRKAFYKPSHTLDLFGEQRSYQRTVTAEGICQFYVQRLKTVFGAVEPEFKMLRNTGNSPIFALMFAVASRDARAQGIALKIAHHIITRI